MVAFFTSAALLEKRLDSLGAMIFPAGAKDSKRTRRAGHVAKSTVSGEELTVQDLGQSDVCRCSNAPLSEPVLFGTAGVRGSDTHRNRSRE